MNRNTTARVSRLSALAVLAMLTITASAQQFQPEFANPRKSYVETIATPDHADSYYRTGQPATLRVVCREGGVPLDGVMLRYKVGPDMWLPETYDSVAFVGGEALVRMGTMTEPGFLACQYEFQAGGKTWRDLVKVGYEPERIRPFATEPADFDQFWQRALREARRVPLEPEYTPIPAATDDRFITSRVRLHVGRNKWMQGFLTVPRGADHSCPILLCPPGAGSKRIHPADEFPRAGFIYMKIEIHDNDQLLPDDDYEQMRRRSSGYTLRGMESPDSFYYKDVYVGCARVIDFLCSLPEWDGHNVVVSGGSQGGALTIVTAALSDRVTCCAPYYPALCDLTGFLHHRAGGWPKYFTNYYSDGRVAIDETRAVSTLQYFDVVNFARRLRVPSFWSWGYNDDTCSPTSIWAAWNEVNAPKQQDITPTSGHWRFPASQERCMEWMRRQMK